MIRTMQTANKIKTLILMKLKINNPIQKKILKILMNNKTNNKNNHLMQAAIQVNNRPRLFLKTNKNNLTSKNKHR